MSGVIEEATREGEVLSSNLTDRETRDFTRKNTRLAMNRADRKPNKHIFFFLLA